MSPTAIADEALDWRPRPATTGRSRWPPSRQALAASTIAELRERVDHAAALLDEAGNVYQLAGLLAGASAYAALMHGQRSRRQGARRPRDSARARARRSLPLDAPARQPRAGRAADRRHRRRSRRVPRGTRALPRTRRPSLRLRRPRRPCRGRRGPRRHPPRRPALLGAAAATATTHHRTPSRPGSTRHSSSPPARATDATPGMPPRATAAR